jgi:hypothetical protein
LRVAREWFARTSLASRHLLPAQGMRRSLERRGIVRSCEIQGFRVPALPILQKTVGSVSSRFFQTSDIRIRPSAYRFTPIFPGREIGLRSGKPDPPASRAAAQSRFVPARSKSPSASCGASPRHQKAGVAGAIPVSTRSFQHCRAPEPAAPGRLKPRPH